MGDDLPYLTQSGISGLIVDMLKSPERYVGRPVVIWRSAFGDGIQAHLAYRTCRDYNRRIPREQWKWYKWLKGHLSKPDFVADIQRNLARKADWNPYQQISIVDLCLPEEGGRCLPCSFEDYSDQLNDNWLHEIAVAAGMPVIVHMCFIEHPETFTDAQQYVFRPSFQEWKEFWSIGTHQSKSLVEDFLSTSSTQEELSYRWYWFFHRSPDLTSALDPNTLPGTGGCDFPKDWLNTERAWDWMRKGARINDITRLPEEKIRKAFPPGISSDIVDDFCKFIIAAESLESVAIPKE